MARGNDVATMIAALHNLGRELNGEGWTASNDDHRRLLALLGKYGNQVLAMPGLETKVSRFYEELNDFLASKNFERTIKYFNPESGAGVVSILDVLVMWLYGPYDLTTIDTAAGKKPGFIVPEGGHFTYEVKGDKGGVLINLLTDGEFPFWMYFSKSTPRLSGLGIFDFAEDLMNRRGGIAVNDDGQNYETIHVPKVEFSIKYPLASMLGLVHGSYSIKAANQQYKFRMNEIGARSMVATDAVAFECYHKPVPPLVINDAFCFWYTQGESLFPIAPALVELEDMKEPEGSLEDM